MFESNLTTTISVIVALTAIISPVLTSVITCRHELKLKELELQQKQYEQNVLHIRQLFEDFLSAFNQVCQLKDFDSLSRYSSSYSLVYIYLPKKVRDDLGVVNLLISKKRWDEVIKYVDAISMDICKEMQNLTLQSPPKQHTLCIFRKHPD